MSANIPAELPNIADARLRHLSRRLPNATVLISAKTGRTRQPRWRVCRQARDDTLFSFATRIKARALDRCGELLRQIPASSGGAAARGLAI
jgi:hypothetical protein